MGQVWSSADFDGINPDGFEGGRGSVLAVTAQNAGLDGMWNTGDDILAPLNSNPCPVSVDHSTGDQQNDPLDRVRSFNSSHPGGGQFAIGDGSVQFVTNSIDPVIYRERSTIAGGEIETGFQ